MIDNHQEGWSFNSLTHPNISMISSPVKSGSGEGVRGVAGGGEGAAGGGVATTTSDTESLLSFVPLSCR